MSNVRRQKTLDFGLWTLVIISSLVISHSSLAQEPPQPQWEPYGRLINDTPGNSPQQNPQIVSDGIDGYILVWEDGRSGEFDIYAQRIDEYGNVRWEGEGIPICEAPGNQNFPQMVEDGEGGAIIVWQDYRNGSADIFAQRIDYYGRILWNEGGVPISTAAAGQFAPKLVSDGAGGAVMVWHDYRSAIGEDIYSQRIDKAGKVLWTKDGIVVSAASGTQWFPEIVSDGKSGAVMVWADGRAGANNTDIYAQRIDSSGKALWQKDGIPVCEAGGNQDHPKVTKDFIFVWSDFRGRMSNIYAQKIDSAGNFSWQKDGIAVAPYSMTQLQPAIVSDSLGGAVITWQDQRDDLGNIYVQRVRSDGALLWGESGKPLCKRMGQQEKPLVLKTLSESWMVLWQDRKDIFVQKIGSSGLVLWKIDGAAVVTTFEAQEAPAAVVNRNNEVLVAWQDQRDGNYDVYAQKLDSKGNGLFKQAGKLINASAGSVVQQNIRAIETALGEVMVVFEDARSGYFNIYAQKLDQKGLAGFGKDGIPIAKGFFRQQDPQIISDESGGLPGQGAIVAWKDSRYPAYPKIYANRISSSGKLLWGPAGLSLTSVFSSQDSPKIISDGAGGAIVVWVEERYPLNMRDIYAQRISKEGRLLWGENGHEICQAPLDQTEVEIAPDGAGGACVVWSDFRAGDRNPDIYAQRIDKNGRVLWKEDGVLICGAPDFQRAPTLVKDEKGNALVSWTDKGGGSYDIYTQRISKSGQILWLLDGIPASQVPRTQQNPKITPSGVIIWEDYRYGNWDIFSQKVTLDGKFSWEEGGVPIITTPFTQYAPQIKEADDKTLFIAWEDYRSGSRYDVYLQRLNQEGKLLWPQNGVEVKSLEGGRIPQILVSQREKSFYVFWEDHRGGGRSIYSQKFIYD